MRLFIGIALSEEFRDVLYDFSMRLESKAPGKYVRKDMYHVTLAYIGECDDDMRATALEVMRRCASEFSCFSVLSGKIDGFGKLEKAILHLGLSYDKALHAASDRLRELLTQCQLPFDAKPFVPHITLARNVNMEYVLPENDLSGYLIPVTALTLFHSCRVDDKLCYIPLESIPLN